ncbi:MAG: iron-containing alcohol dehydrogenase [Alphaproteobacteria bacterium]|nr:iron-containing alcohol dehydrogenase [Alphaproteobacteria bacterium]
MRPYRFETTPVLVAGAGSVHALAPELLARGAASVLVVTDPGLMAAGLVMPIVERCRSAGLTLSVFSEVAADPPEAVVLAAANAARASGADTVIGLGGGSAMDTAKLAALLAGTPQALEAIYGIGQAKGPRLRLVQVPTTAGTGSEVTPIAIVTTASHEKKGVVSPLLLADLAVLDADLTLGLPAAVTAATAIDAMVHAIEAYTSRLKKNPISDALAEQALRLLFSNLPRALADGQNRTARGALLEGAMLAGMAFANAPVAAVHALAYPLGGHFHVPHGLSNALVLAPVLRFNLSAAIPEYAALGRLLDPTLHTADDSAAAEAFVAMMSQLVSTMPFAQRLADVGVTSNDLEMLAHDAMAVQRLLINNPKDVTFEDALEIYRSVA